VDIAVWPLRWKVECLKWSMVDRKGNDRAAGGCSLAAVTKLSCGNRDAFPALRPLQARKESPSEHARVGFSLEVSATVSCHVRLVATSAHAGNPAHAIVGGDLLRNLTHQASLEKPRARRQPSRALRLA